MEPHTITIKKGILVDRELFHLVFLLVMTVPLIVTCKKEKPTHKVLVCFLPSLLDLTSLYRFLLSMGLATRWY